MTTIRLVDIDGMLHFPTGGRTYEGGPHDKAVLLMRFYEAGDMDTIPWPMYSDFSTVVELRKRLACALFDERETNPTWPSGVVVIELPDGTVFDFDREIEP